MLGPPVPVTTLCDVVSLEWDRGHETFDAIVRLDGDEGVVVTAIHDHWPMAGCRWIRRAEIVELEPLDEHGPTIRVLDRLGVRRFGVDPALGSLAVVLSNALDTPAPIAVYTRRTGSDECLVGVMSSADDLSCVLREVDTGGAFTGANLTYDVADIISVEWGTDYLNALEILLDE